MALQCVPAEFVIYGLRIVSSLMKHRYKENLCDGSCELASLPIIPCADM